MEGWGLGEYREEKQQFCLSRRHWLSSPGQTDVTSTGGVQWEISQSRSLHIIAGVGGNEAKTERITR